MTYISNAFSLQMLKNLNSRIETSEVPTSEVAEADFISAIGHTDTAAVVSSILGKEVPCQRISITLDEGDVLYVAQLIGGRLPEGATTLPKNFTIKFVKIELKKKGVTLKDFMSIPGQGPEKITIKEDDGSKKIIKGYDENWKKVCDKKYESKIVKWCELWGENGDAGYMYITVE